MEEKHNLIKNASDDRKLIDEPASFNSGVDYKLKWSREAISFDDLNKFEPLSAKMTELALDNSKNEKIGIQFRALKKEENEFVIIDISNRMEIWTATKLPITGEQMMEFAKEYKVYIDTHYKQDLILEVVHYYFPLEKTNKTQEIPEDDKLVETIFLPRNEKSLINEVRLMTPMATNENILKLRDNAEKQEGNLSIVRRILK